MAIIIPSKNIYEIDNQKVIDNEVDNIEVSVKRASIITESKLVHDEKINAVPLLGGTQSNYNYQEKPDSVLVGDHTAVAFAYVRADTKRDVTTIRIPMKGHDFDVIRLFRGEDENGEARIKYSLKGTVKRGNITGSVTIKSNGNGEGFRFQNVAIGAPTSVTTVEGTTYSIPKNIEKSAQYAGDVASVSATEKFTLEDDITNVSYAQFSDLLNDEKSITLYFLSGATIYKLGGGGKSYAKNGIFTQDMQLSGEYEEYIPTEISVSVYGDVLSLKLEDETIKIGDGQHVYSFSGNELMLANNEAVDEAFSFSIGPSVKNEGGYSYYSIPFPDTVEVGDRFTYNTEAAVCVFLDGQKVIKAPMNGQWSSIAGKLQSFLVRRISATQIKDAYSKIIEENSYQPNWRNGKETAIIRCAIDNYGETKELKSGNLNVISARYNGEKTTIEFMRCWMEGTFKDEQNQILSIFLEKDGATYELKNIRYDYHLLGDIEGHHYDYQFTAARIIYNDFQISKTSDKMSFAFGDVVEPHIRSAKGEDVPMSFTKYGTPKHFVVIGKRIIFDGMVQQELTLQEVND